VKLARVRSADELLELLRNVREDHEPRVTLEMLADRARCNPGSICSNLRGKTRMSVDTLIAVVDVLNADVAIVPRKVKR
jgi:hypothetical protein